MTASSVDFFPCRVQLMGLPRSALAATHTSSRSGNSVRPSNAKLKGISRNLFGSPDPAEMKHLYQEEAERLRTYVLQRYHFDTEISKPRKERQKSTQQTLFPTLIEQEINQNRQYLLEEKASLNFVPAEVHQSNDKQFHSSEQYTNFNHRSCKFCPLSQSVAEHHKPYTRQSLLTEKFNMRKNRTNVTKNCCQRDDKIIILENSQNYHGISQCTNLKQSVCDITESGNELLIYKNLNNHEIATNSSTSISGKNNSTTLSLQIILSTDNLS